MAAAGVGSRRFCEELILAGRVTVDGRIVSELGTRVDPGAAEIRVEGERIRPARKCYYLVNKPAGVVSTNRDPSGRARVVDLVPDSDEHLFTVGRLDRSSEGLLIVTNDGEFANRLAHPRFNVEKTYQVLVAGTPTPAVLKRLERGIHLAEGRASAVRVKLKSLRKHSAVLQVVLSEGKNREIRRMLARLGHKVLRLRRTAMGGLKLGELPSGRCRPLTWAEIQSLQRTAGMRRRRPDGRNLRRGNGRGRRRPPPRHGKGAPP